MKHLQPRSLKQLLQDVELVAEIDSGYDPHYITDRIPLYDGNTITRIQSILANSIVSRTTTLRDGKPMFIWLDSLRIRVRATMQMWIAMQHREDLHPIYEQMAIAHGFYTWASETHNILDSGLDEQIVKRMQEYAKMDKYGNSTVANTLRALFFFLGIDESEWERLIKAFTVKTQATKAYVYRTRYNIEHHYRELLEHQSLRSCMTYGAERLDEYHCVEVSSESKLKRYSAKYSTVFQAPIASYNDLDDVQLGLVSYSSPEELQSVNDYPFIGRTLLVRKGDNWSNYVRWYGREGFECILRDNGFKRTNLDGIKVRAFVSHKQRNEQPVYIIPYFDGDYNVCSIDVDNMHHDTDGKAFHWAEVLDCSKKDYDFSDYEPEEYRKHYRIDQNAWIALKMPFHTQCALTNVELDRTNGYWNTSIGAYTIKALKDTTLDGLRIATIEKKRKELAELEEQLQLISNKVNKEYAQLYLELPLADYERLPSMNKQQRIELTKLLRLYEVFKDDLNDFGVRVALTINTLYLIQLRKGDTKGVDGSPYPQIVYILEDVLAHVTEYSTGSNARTTYVLDRYHQQIDNLKKSFDK